MKKYIKIYDNVINEDICKTLYISLKSIKTIMLSSDLENHRYFTEININHHIDSNIVDVIYYIKTIC